LPIVDHPEDRGLTEGAEANDGFVATVLGLRGWPVAAEEAAVARDLAVLADVVRDVPGARLHLTHVSRRARWTWSAGRRPPGRRHPRRARITSLTDELAVGPDVGMGRERRPARRRDARQPATVARVKPAAWRRGCGGCSAASLRHG
jgi:hypothetical protein